MTTQYQVKGTIKLDFIEWIIYDIDGISLSMKNIHSCIFKKTKGSEYEFTIEFQAKNEAKAKEKADTFVDSYINTLSFSLDFPINNYQITEIKEKHGTKNILCTDIERDIELTGCERRKINKKLLQKINQNLEKIPSESEDRYCLNLYLKSFSGNHIENFWNIYNILLILIGGRDERRNIDREYQNYLNIPNNPGSLWQNNHDGQSWTVLTAIRDSFSHKTEFNRNMDIHHELKNNMNDFRNFARWVICQKYNLTI